TILTNSYIRHNMREVPDFRPLTYLAGLFYQAGLMNKKIPIIPPQANHLSFFFQRALAVGQNFQNLKTFVPIGFGSPPGLDTFQKIPTFYS
ncbi:unnamed protein product, partial [marine sediment metagenome]